MKQNKLNPFDFPLPQIDPAQLHEWQQLHRLKTSKPFEIKLMQIEATQASLDEISWENTNQETFWKQHFFLGHLKLSGNSQTLTLQIAQHFIPLILQPISGNSKFSTYKTNRLRLQFTHSQWIEMSRDLELIEKIFKIPKPISLQKNSYMEWFWIFCGGLKLMFYTLKRK